jgi:hypothetical protein
MSVRQQRKLRRNCLDDDTLLSGPRCDIIVSYPSAEMSPQSNTSASIAAAANINIAISKDQFLDAQSGESISTHSWPAARSACTVSSTALWVAGEPLTAVSISPTCISSRLIGKVMVRTVQIIPKSQLLGKLHVAVWDRRREVRILAVTRAKQNARHALEVRDRAGHRTRHRADSFEAGVRICAQTRCINENRTTPVDVPVMPPYEMRP